jgi:hypothetical protein
MLGARHGRSGPGRNVPTAKLVLALGFVALLAPARAFAPSLLRLRSHGLSRDVWRLADADSSTNFQGVRSNARVRGGSRHLVCGALDRAVDRMRYDGNRQPRLKRVAEGVFGFFIRMMLFGGAEGLKVNVKAGSNREVRILAAEPFIAYLTM